MRLVLSVLVLLCATVVAWAQSDDFNPYQAVIDRMALSDAEPLIVAAYGEVRFRNAAINEPYVDGPVLVLGLGFDDRFATFLFCDGTLAAFSAPLTPTVAAQILRPLTRTGLESAVVANDDGISVFAADDELIVRYSGVGTKTSSVSATYPATPMMRFDFSDYCETLAD